MTGAHCDECGARYADATDSCADRFALLLALDHSREEPWGSRHGLAFAVFALQHPRRFPAATRERSHELLRRVFEQGESLEHVVRDLRRRGAHPGAADAAPPAAAPPFPTTIADLGAFEAGEYAQRLERWCRDTLTHLRGGARAPD